MEDEIRIRVESIRIELDSLQSQLLDECRKFKNKILAKLNDEISKVEKQFENYSKVLSKNAKNHEESIGDMSIKLKENIYNCQSFVKEIQNFDFNFNQTLKKCSFIPSDWIPGLSIIGRFNQSAHINFDAAYKSNLEVFNFESTVKSLNRLCNLKDETLLLTSSDDNTIVQLDDKFNELRKINSIENHKLTTPLSLCSDDYENIYICDLGSNCVIVTDENFSRIKKIIGKKSIDCGQPIEPLDICFSNNTLYVLNKDSSYVTTFTRDGDFERQFLLRANIKCDIDENNSTEGDILLMRPNRIGANSKIFAVLDSFRKVYLYDCVNGDLKQVIKSNNSTIMCLIDDYLMTCNRDGSLVCYQNNDNKYSQTFERTYDLLKDSKSYMCIFNNKILVALTDSKSIISI